MKTHVHEPEPSTNFLPLHPSFKIALEAASLDVNNATVCWKTARPPYRREEILLSDGQSYAVWKVDSLRSLFRFSVTEPSADQHAVVEIPTSFSYMPLFFFIEEHVIGMCDLMGDVTDREFEVAYRSLRHDPDGDSSNALHAYLWQVAAVVLGMRSVSSVEFQAIFERLAQSAANQCEGFLSRSYIATLRDTNHLHTHIPRMASRGTARVGVSV